ncbi:MAG: hypothetical protein M1827_007031 [Pycnora praestabilis]|nr:MAG: hypothetical protein M1827_007031 [Pycnora praestabilis]
MKSKRKSPQHELLHMRTFRLESQPESQNLHMEELFTDDMHGVNAFDSPDHDALPSNRQDSKFPLTSFPRHHDPFLAQKDPIMDHPTTSTPPPDTPISRSPDPSIADLSLSDMHSPQWSSAVGRATTGKSGRVIERLMAENDRLRRELKLETLRREEEQKRGEMARANMHNLQATNENLVQMQEVDRASMVRKERKSEELRGDLEHEKTRREKAEREAREVCKERDEVVGKCRRDVQDEKEKARKASAQYEVLSSSWRQMEENYKRTTKQLSVDLEKLEEDRREDLMQLERLELVCEQLRHEGERCQKTKDAVSQMFEEYRAEAESGTREIRERAEKNERANEEALQEMERVIGEMKYVMNIRNDTRDKPYNTAVERRSATGV